MRARQTMAMAGLGAAIVVVQAVLAVTILGSAGSGLTATAASGRSASPQPVSGTPRLPDDLVGDGTRPEVREPTRPGTPLTAGYGNQGDHWASRHTGLDFNGDWGDPVYAVADGRIVRSYYHPAYGNMLVLRLDSGVEIWYAHLDTVLRDSGRVRMGRKIATMGSTGNSTGAHLHLEVRVDGVPTDPAGFLWGEHPGRPDSPASWACEVYDCR